ncbi:MAG: hypothetical protein AAF633_08730 [Chloroflexota bacterium]
MYISIFGVVTCILVYFWPSPEWVNDEYRLDEVDVEKTITRQERRQALFRALALIFVGLTLTMAMNIFGQLPILFSLIMSVAVIAMVYPTIRQTQERRRQKKGRTEALSIAEFVAGRMSAQAPVFESFENLHQEHADGKRELEVVGEDLGEMIRRVRLGNPLSEELFKLSKKFEDLNSLRYVFTSYRLMVEAEMGQEAEIYQANDLSEAQTISEELANTLETEMSTATMSRVMMFLLIGGMIGFLVFFGDGLGDVLINTPAGNGVLGFSLFTLWLAQTIGSKLEELPPLEF